MVEAGDKIRHWLADNVHSGGASLQEIAALCVDTQQMSLCLALGNAVRTVMRWYHANA